LFGNGATSTVSDPVYTYMNSGVYNVKLIATDLIPCSDTTSLAVSVDSTSVVSIGVTDSVLCQGTYVTFTGVYTTIGLTGVTWDFGYGDSMLNVNPVVHAFNGATTYTVTVTPHYRACVGTPATKVVNVFPQPSISLGSDTSICAGSETITLKDEVNAGNGAASWLWSTGSRTSSTIIVAPGVYFATVAINNCYSSDTIVVNPDCYMNIPNVFTPNGDGVNDFFYPRSLLTRGLTSFKMNLYNRWGQLIFETSSLDGGGWDGKLNGVPQPQGVFVYIIDATFRDGQKEHHQGNVTLIR
jgi:gliding motility-associated-like protein